MPLLDLVRALPVIRTAHCVPLQGAAFEQRLSDLDGVGVRIAAEKIFAFRDPA